MKITENHEFFRNWCSSIKFHLMSGKRLLKDLNDEEYFNSLVKEVETVFADHLHECMEDHGGVARAAEGVLLSWEEIKHIVEHYGDDHIITEDKIGEYVLYDLALNVVETMMTKREKIIDNAI